MFRLVETLNLQLKSVFPELEKQKNLALNVIREEETSFLKTLDQGLTLLDTLLASTKDKKIDGAKVFELYDTFGFPLDLTALIARERGFSIDEESFDSQMKKQRERSRAASVSVTDDWQVLYEDEVEEFVGYDLLSTQVKITKYRKVNTKKDGDFFQLVLNITPFYPEGGGQVGDKGYLETENGAIHYIVDTKKENNLILHYCKTLPQKIEGKFNAVVDPKQRHRSAANHTATHLMHQALRTVLGTHVEQKGSMVHSGMFRFDFSHFSKVTTEELVAVENFVNARIEEQLPLQESRNIPYQKALGEGAIALFGEKYGDTVRTIRFGQSMELCGGTHVANTSEIWRFKITSESAVAAGIRRVEAITGDAVIKFFEDQSQTLQQLNSLLKGPQDIAKSVQQLQEENTHLKKELNDLQRLKSQVVAKEVLGEIKEVKGISFLAKKVDMEAPSLKDLSFELGKNFDNLFLVLGATKGDKPIISCYISKALVSEKGMDAGKVVRELGKYIQGGGGGQPFFAIAGGKNTAGITQALAEAINLI